MPFSVTVLDRMMVGSQVTCDPIPARADVDWLFLVEAITPELREKAYIGDYEALSEDTRLVVIKEKCVDLIFVDDPELFQAWKAATHVCKTLNLLQKDLRILVCQAVLYRNVWQIESPSTATPIACGPDEYDPFGD